MNIPARCVAVDSEGRILLGVTIINKPEVDVLPASRLSEARIGTVTEEILSHPGALIIDIKQVFDGELELSCLCRDREHIRFRRHPTQGYTITHIVRVKHEDGTVSETEIPAQARAYPAGEAGDED